MFHQWFNTRRYGDKKKALIEAIEALGPNPIPYGEQPYYEQKMQNLKNLFADYVDFCEKEHEKLIANEQDDFEF